MSTVSVILPTYNRAEFLQRSVTSVLSQDFDDIELLIVDDGSTDHTAKKVQRLKSYDSRIRYFQLSKNRGIGFARDFGLHHVSGEYIAWIDSDDLWVPNKLKYQVEVMEKYPTIEIFFSNFWNINHVTKSRSRAFDQEDNKAGIDSLTVRPLDNDLWFVLGGVEAGLLRSTFIQLGTTLMRRNVLMKVGGVNKELRSAEDFEFSWRAAIFKVRYAYTDRLLMERNVQSSSVTMQNVIPLVEKLKALDACFTTSTMMQCFELHDKIFFAQDRVWRNLIWFYGRNGQRYEAMQTFLNSLQSKITIRRVLFLITALFGPWAISTIVKVKKTVIEWLENSK